MSNELQAKPQKPAPLAPQRQVRVVQDDSALSFMMDTARFEHMYRIAEAMSSGSFIPTHIRGKSPAEARGNCFRVVSQAMRWGLDPFAVIDETYVVAGKLGYQGKLVAAVINARSNLLGGLKCVYNTKVGDDFAAVIFGSSEAIPRNAYPLLQKYADGDQAAWNELTALGVKAVRLTVGQGKTTNKMWKEDPEQKLFYTGATKWARRWKPEIMLGIVTEDELERIASNPQPQVDMPLLPPAAGRQNLRAPRQVAAFVTNGNGHEEPEAAEEVGPTAEESPANQDREPGSDG